jgi:hypothetical protein
MGGAFVPISVGEVSIPVGVLTAGPLVGAETGSSDSASTGAGVTE